MKYEKILEIVKSLPKPSELKTDSDILKSNLDKVVKWINKQFWLYQKNLDFGEYYNHLYYLSAKKLYCDITTDYCKQYHRAEMINLNTRKRAVRLKQRIESIVQSSNSVWVTLTFRDDVLNSTSEYTRRKYVTRFFKDNSFKYVANQDFGTKTNREHYHGVAQCNIIDPDSWQYGFCWLERIYKINDTDKRLAKYISKLSNHALKESNKKQRIIYSKNI